MKQLEIRAEVALAIMNFEARRDKKTGRVVVYALPKNDGGGIPAPGYPHGFEVCGVNNRYHPHEASDLAVMVKAGRYAAAEQRAAQYVATYTDSAELWSLSPAVVAYLRDCIFNRGARGAGKILQYAVGGGLKVDGIVGPKTRAAVAAVPVRALLTDLRAARELYERKHAKRDESSDLWKGLVNRWNKALKMAEKYL